MRARHRDGWYEDHQRGSHLYLLHPTTPKRVTVSLHATKTLKPATLASILDDAGLTMEEFRRLL